MKRILFTILFIMIGLNILYAKKSVTIKIIWWGNKDRNEKTLKVIELYKKQNPDIKIETIYTSWTGYYEKLATLVAANEIPDIVQMSIQNMPQYDEKNLFENLYDINSIDITDMDAAALASGKYQGNLLGISLGTTAPALVYNRELFLKAGVEFPGENWTWSDLEKKSFMLHKNLGIIGICNIALDYNDFEIFAREKGESIYSNDSKSAGFKDSTLGEFFEMCLRMQKSGSMENIKTAIQSRSNEEMSSYAEEKSAMRFLWSNKIVSVNNVMKKDSEIMAYPGPDSATGIYSKSSMFFSIPKSSRNKEAAGKFISYFVNDIEANRILNSERGVPVFSKVRKAMIPLLDSQNAKIFNYIDNVNLTSMRPMDPQFPEFDRELKKEMQLIFEKVLFEKISPEEGARSLISKWNSILSKNTK